MAMTLIQSLQAGAVLRYRRSFGFYTVHQGKTTAVDQNEAERAVRTGRVRPEAKDADKFGVWHFSLINKGVGQ
ncbi:hypothetical protein [Delftia sp. PE138]|uniref:hypothetical protein n=1 Tax=Delftia sp. PE138 TaxID=1812483 RepID=UPI001E00A84A|nr:hypothetical protein [Delftia sp. PE138]MBS3723415.1 hypothetical protein [Delftia sp. PE138]